MSSVTSLLLIRMLLAEHRLLLETCIFGSSLVPSLNKNVDSLKIEIHTSDAYFV